MKVEHNPVQIYTSATAETKFGIDITAKAFEMLSGNLYEHKITAIVRELCANAYDSHVSANRADVPFKVVLPNSLHPYFEVEDYGIGLDDEAIRTIYTVMFKSTKQNSNSDIGAFGLGSKTPIAYTHSFNIRSRKNGIERNYTCYKDSDGIPCINLLSEQETSEQNGVKISVPVKSGDFYNFLDDAEFILSFFKTRPTVPLESFKFNFEKDKIDSLYENGFAILNVNKVTSDLYCGNSFFAVMGGICYPVSLYSIMNVIEDEKIKNYLRYRIGKNFSFFLNFEIGELSLNEISISRESLSTSEETLKKISTKVEQYVSELIEREQSLIDDCKDGFELVSCLRHSGEDCTGVVDTFKSYEFPEYLQFIDLSVIPDDWEEVWITQDSNDDIIAYNNLPVICIEGTWWKTTCDQDLWVKIVDSGNSYDDVVNTTWENSLYRYR